jgi:hypothetical protein
MSQNENVTASITNNTDYTIKYQSVDVLWGNYYNKNTTIDPHSTTAIFYAVGAEGSGTGCQGNVTYGFTDQNGNAQTFVLTYEDPYSGSNSFGTASLPNGITGSSNDPQGGPVVVTYMIGGAVPASASAASS